MCSPANIQLTLKILYTTFQIASDLWNSPYGLAFRDWYNREQQQKKHVENNLTT